MTEVTDQMVEAGLVAAAKVARDRRFATWIGSQASREMIRAAIEAALGSSQPEPTE